MSANTQSTNDIVAIEDSGTDVLYRPARDEAERNLRDRFLKFAFPGEDIHPGDNLFKTQEDWDQALLNFGAQEKMRFTSAVEVEKEIFDTPQEMHAGGSLANSFHTLTSASINGKPLAQGVFVSTVGADEPGRIFADSLKDRLQTPPPEGKQLIARIIPVGNDRIMITSPSAKDSPNQSFNHKQMNGLISPETKLVMLGGYMHYAGHHGDFAEHIVRDMARLPGPVHKRPILALTMGAEPIAQSGCIQHAISTAEGVARVVVSGNMEELSAFLKLPDAWKNQYESCWYVDDQGQPLMKNATYRSLPDALNAGTPEGTEWAKEHGFRRLSAHEQARAEEQNEPYQQSLADHKKWALKKLGDQYKSNPNVTFIITDGRNGAYTVDNRAVPVHYPAPDMSHRQILSTAGAGDQFFAGFLLGKMHGLDEQECVKLGGMGAREIICQEQVRFEPLGMAHDDQNKVSRKRQAGGLPAYFNMENATEKLLFDRLQTRSQALVL